MFLLTIVLIVCCVLSTTAGNKPPTYYPNLPMGEFKAKFKANFPCEPTGKHKLQYNTYLSKKSATVFEVRGNMTYLIPFDDSISLNINMAQRGSIGGWIENAHVYTTTKACSKSKFLYGQVWQKFIDGFHFTDKDCPLRPGVYVSSGIDVDKLVNTNFPRIFFYGEYKMTLTFTRSSNGEKLGCSVFVLNIIRPWEN